MQIVENISLIMTQIYETHIHLFCCRNFHVQTAVKPLYQSQQPDPDMATNSQCSDENLIFHILLVICTLPDTLLLFQRLIFHLDCIWFGNVLG